MPWLGWIATIKLALQSFIAIRQDIRDVRDMLHKADVEGWFKKSAEVTQDLQPGSSGEEKMDAAEKVQDLIKHM